MKTRNLSALLAVGLALKGAIASAGNLDLVRQLNQAFVEVAEKVSPSVVVITVTEKAAVFSDSDLMYDEPDSGPFDSLPPNWRRFHEQLQEEPPEEGEQNQGSGIIIRKDGYILTNRHVVDNAERIDVRLRDGRAFKAAVRGADPQSDLAVLKIDAENLPVAQFADSSRARVGEFAIAIGAPFNLDYSVTYGHVSAKSRSHVIPGGAAMDQDFIQTDANINPGNSGGPLVNIDGEVMGVNTLIRGLHTGIGFAIPSNLAKEISDKLIVDGKFTRAWLGIGIAAVRDVPEFHALVKGIDDGVLVQSIFPNGPAAKANLCPSDVIVKVAGRPVSTPQQLRDEIRRAVIGEPVDLEVFRAGRMMKVAVRPTEYAQSSVAVAVANSRKPANTASTGVGITVENLTRELADRFGVSMTKGVIVVSVEEKSSAARRGIKPGDVITSITTSSGSPETISNSKQLSDALAKADLKKGVIVNFLAGDVARFEILKEEDE
jgi:serine protease Do